jgi:hypothetical protein
MEIQWYSILIIYKNNELFFDFIYYDAFDELEINFEKETVEKETVAYNELMNEIHCEQE